MLILARSAQEITLKKTGREDSSNGTHGEQMVHLEKARRVRKTPVPASYAEDKSHKHGFQESTGGAAVTSTGGST